MSHIGDLLQRLRTSPGQADYTEAKRALERAQDDRSKELEELRALVEDLRDRFNPAAAPETMQQFLQGDDSTLPPPIPQSLAADLSTLSDPGEVPKRFSADLALVREQLLGRQPLTDPERITRLFEFFAPYAERLVTLAPKGHKRREGAVPLLDTLELLGFGAAFHPATGRSALETAERLLTAATLEDFTRRRQRLRDVRFAPVVSVVTEGGRRRPPERDELERTDAEREVSGVSYAPDRGARPKRRPARPRATRQGGLPIDRMDDEERERVQDELDRASFPVALLAETPDEVRAAGAEPRPNKRGRPTREKLLWGWLDRFRRKQRSSDERPEAERREIEKLAAAALLALLLIFVVALALFTAV